MAREKKPVHNVVMTEGKRNIIQQLLQEYDIESDQNIQNALKDLLGGTIKEMMEAEMDDHLGYSKSKRSDSDDYRNVYKTKQGNSSHGSMEIEVSQDRKSTFEPQVVKKHQKDMYHVDSMRKGQSEKGILENRQQSVKPLVDSYFAWLKNIFETAGLDKAGKTYKAFRYSLNQKPYLRQFLNNAIILMHQDKLTESYVDKLVSRSEELSHKCRKTK
jgi:hypothetical protein